MIEDDELEYTFSDDVSEQEHLLRIVNKQGKYNFQSGDVTFSNPRDISPPQEWTYDKKAYDPREMLAYNNNVLNLINTEVDCSFRSGYKGLKFNTLKYHRLNLVQMCKLVYGNEKMTYRSSELYEDWVFQKMMAEDSDEVEDLKNLTQLLKTTIIPSLFTIRMASMTIVRSRDDELSLTPKTNSLIYQPKPLILSLEQRPIGEIRTEDDERGVNPYVG